MHILATSRIYNNKISEFFSKPIAKYPVGKAWISLSAFIKELCTVLTIRMATVSPEELHAIIEPSTLAHGIVGTIFKIEGILLTLWHLWILLVMPIYWSQKA